mgnify:CR=1 FL=1
MLKYYKGYNTVENITNIYDKITNILASKKLKSEQLKEFCQLVHMLAKQKLNITCNDLEFEKFSKNSYGYTIDGRVVINHNFLKPKYIYELVHTIFHEDRHIYQKQSNFIQKDVNVFFDPSLPILHSNDFIYLLNEEQMYLNPFYLYYTSKVERDSDSYANIETYNLLRKLKQIFTKNKKLSNLLDTQLKKLKSKMDKNEQLYKSRLSQLKVFEKSYKGIIKKLADEKLIQYQNSPKLFKLASAIFQIYCDTDITKKYFDYAIENKDTDVLFCVVNAPFSKIDNAMLNKFFEYCKNQNLSYDFIQQNLFYWNKNSLNQNYNLFNSPNKNSQEDEIKQAKIKLYQSLESIEIQEK